VTAPGHPSVGLQVVPSIKIADGRLTAYLDTAVNLKFVGIAESETLVIDGEWFVNPCVKVTLGSKLTFNTGFQLAGGFAAEMMTWKIPVGMQFSF